MLRCLLLTTLLITVISCNTKKEDTTSTSDTTKKDTSSLKTETIDSIDYYYDKGNAETMPVPVARLISPGKSIGLTSIGQKNADVKKQLGEPMSEDAGMGKELATWSSTPILKDGGNFVNQVNVFFVTNMGGPDETSRVDHIRATSSFFGTAQHVMAGSGIDSIRNYFPGIKKIATYTSPATKKTVTIYDDNNAGIAFEVGGDQRCVGITVHKPGQQAYEVYNALFSDIKFD